MGDGPKEDDSQEENPFLYRNYRDKESEEIEKPLYMAIAEACGEIDTSHIQNCSEKNCWTKVIEGMEVLSEEEEDVPQFNAASIKKIARVVKLGRLLSGVLRHRARQMNLPLNRDGYVPLDQMLRHPVFSGVTVDEIQELVDRDPRKRYQIVRDSSDNLHIRAQYGHSMRSGVNVEHPEVSPDQLPSRVAHLIKRYQIPWTLSDGVRGGYTGHIRLREMIPKPGETDGCESGEKEAVVIIDVKYAAQLGVKYHRTNGGVLLARAKIGREQRNVIPSQAILEIRKMPSGERIYPTATGEPFKDTYTKLDMLNEGPAFPEELVKEPEPIETLKPVEVENKSQYPRADVSYTVQGEMRPRPRFLRCVRTTTGKSYMIRGHIANMPNPVKFLLDTGANMNIIPLDIFVRIPDVFRPKMEKSKHNIEVGDGREMEVKGIISTKIKVGAESYEAKFYVTRLGTQAVLGTSFMTDYAMKISLGEPPTCMIRNERVELIVSGDRSQRVRIMQTITVKPKEEMQIRVNVKNPHEVAGQELFEPSMLLRRKHGITAPEALVDVKDESFTVTVYNPNAQEVILHEKTCVGVLSGCEEVHPVYSSYDVEKDENNNDEIEENSDATSEDDSDDDKGSLKCNSPEVDVDKERLGGSDFPPHLTDLYNRSIEGIDKEHHDAIKQILAEFSDIFATDPGDIGRTNLIVHDIYTGRANPVHQRARRFSPDEHAAMKKTVESLHSVGIVEPSRSEWASNVRMVKKKDGSWRMCVDYRDLNAKTKIRDPYPLPRIDAMLDNLAGSRMFSCLDLIWGYHQVPLTEEAKLRTAFITPQMSPSHWQYIYMPFGLRDAPATFQRLVDKMLVNIQYDYAMAYLDDIIVKGDDVASSLLHLREVFRRIRSAGLKLKPSKCELFRREISYLGHVINENGLKTDPKKVDAVRKWPIPIYLTDVRGFIGLCSYYRRFIKNFGEQVKVLSTLTTKNSDRVWREEHTEAFRKMKEALTNTPLLAHPQEGSEYILDTDASTWAIGAVLSQRQKTADGKEEERPIAYASRLLLPRELNYCTRKRELLAIYEWVQYFQHYLAGQKFTVRTDHDSLKGLNNLARVPGQFARWIDYLNAFTFDIKVRAGAQHSNADFLSRVFGDCFCKTREVFERTESAREALRNEPILDWDLFEKCAREVANRRIRCPSSELIKILDKRALSELQERDLRDQMEMGSKLDCNVTPEEYDRVRRRAEKAIFGDKDNAHEKPKLFKHETPQTTLTFQPWWTKEEMVQAQQEDEDLQLLYDAKKNNRVKPSQIEISGLGAAGKAYMRDWSLIDMKHDLLYRYYEDATRSQAYWRLLIPNKYQQEVVEKLHEHGIACHQGYLRTVKNIKLRYDWYDLRSQIRIYTRACPVCQRKRTKNVNTRHEMTGHLPGYRGERVNMDVCGPFMESNLGNKYLLVICDSFTRYVKAVPVTDTKATTLALAFLNEWCYLFGFPTEVHTDRGTYFTSEFWKEMCSKLNLKHTLGSALRPQSNGLNERLIRAVQENLRIAIDGHRKKDWDIRVAYATASYNFTPHTATNFAPHELMFGELPQMQIDFLFKDKEPERNTPGEFLQNLLKKMKETFSQVRRNLRKTMELRKEKYDDKIKTKKYKIGDPVAIKTTNKLVGNDKLADKYDGPYYILSIWDNGTIRIQNTARTKPKLIHVDRVEPWTQAANDVTPDWVAPAVKRFAPLLQEVGVQVELDFKRGEVIGARSSPALFMGCSCNHTDDVPQLSPIKPRKTKNFHCRVCGEFELDDYGVFRSFTRSGVCHICCGTPDWHIRSQPENFRRDAGFRQRRRDLAHERNPWGLARAPYS